MEKNEKWCNLDRMSFYMCYRRPQQSNRRSKAHEEIWGLNN